MRRLVTALLVTNQGLKSVNTRDWHHAPIHQLTERGAYMVTAATLHNEHHFRTRSRLTLLHDQLLELAEKYGWQLEAWAVFSNHYHFVAQSPTDGAVSLGDLTKELHSLTARALNREDQADGRQVWFQYWESLLTIRTSYFARLNYVHDNSVKHGLVQVASAYPWCSAAWFERNSPPAKVRLIRSFGTDRLKVSDDFDPVVED